MLQGSKDTNVPDQTNNTRPNLSIPTWDRFSSKPSAAAQLLGVVGAILEGELLPADDELEGAIALLEEVDLRPPARN